MNDTTREAVDPELVKLRSASPATSTVELIYRCHKAAGRIEAAERARDEARAEIERLREVMRTIVSRCQDAKRLAEEGYGVSAYNLASGILGQIGGDVAALTGEGETNG